MRSESRASPFVNRCRILLLAVAATVAFTGCGTMSDMVTSNIPTHHTGKASVVVKLHEQRAYLYRGKNIAAESRISSGREGHRTPIGHYSIIRKDEDHGTGVGGGFI